MREYRWMRRAVLTGAISIPLVLASGCGMISGQKENMEIDPPQQTSLADSAMADVTGKAAATAQGQETKMTVYVKDANGYIAPVTLNAALRTDEKAGQKALEMMVEDGPETDLLPAGFQGILPKDTKILSFNVVKDQKMAVVDFSKEFTDYNVQDERRIVEALTWTLTGLPDIERVQIWDEGEQLGEMPVDGFPLDEPLTRAVGINLEKAEGVSYSDTMPVTLYFSSVTDEDEQYYVPVTRLVKRNTDAAKTAMEQLISGPLPNDNLTAVMTQDIQVKTISLKDDTVTVNLLDQSYQPGHQSPAEMLQAVVLSLTENTGASKVQIQMNGNADVTGTDNLPYGKPVSRPDHVNALKL
jgi:germination protein M